MLFFMIHPLFAEESWTDQMKRQFDDIKMRLDLLEQQNKNILDQKDKTLKGLEQVRIQMRHNPGSPTP